jgi:hypothetical protein
MISYPFIRPSRAYMAFEEAWEVERTKARRHALVTLALLLWALTATIKLADARHKIQAQDVFIQDCGEHFLLSGGR